MGYGRRTRIRTRLDGIIWATVILVSLLGAEASSADGDGVIVSYGSALKLMHGASNNRLHSSGFVYEPETPYHVVSGHNKRVADSNSYWVVKPVKGSPTQQGVAVPNGSIIRLKHMRANCWLHSRSHPSPLSRNFEVSCRAGRGGNGGDLWRLQFVEESEVWMKDRKVRLKHVDTGNFLHSPEKTVYTRVIPGQMEVCGVVEESRDNVWLAAEGVYIEA